MPGGHSGEVIPVPIPNTEVKLSYADDTAFWWESRKLPGFFHLFKLLEHYLNRPNTSRLSKFTIDKRDIECENFRLIG